MLKFLCKLVNLTGSYKRKQKGMLFSEHNAYGLEACPLLKSDLSSLDFVINQLLMKLFKTSNIDVVKCCQDHFGF